MYFYVPFVKPIWLSMGLEAVYPLFLESSSCCFLILHPKLSRHQYSIFHQCWCFCEPLIIHVSVPWLPPAYAQNSMQLSKQGLLMCEKKITSYVAKSMRCPTCAIWHFNFSLCVWNFQVASELLLPGWLLPTVCEIYLFFWGVVCYTWVLHCFLLTCHFTVWSVLGALF